MNNLVPITHSLPFTNIQWKTSPKVVKIHSLCYDGFLRKFLISDNYADDVDLEIPLKVKCINLIFDDWKGQNFRGYTGGKRVPCECLDEFEECLGDFEI